LRRDFSGRQLVAAVRTLGDRTIRHPYHDLSEIRRKGQRDHLVGFALRANQHGTQ
jgi:hypothetical protein